MTIIEPNKNKIRVNLILVLLMGMVGLSILSGIYLYNQTVDLRHTIKNDEAMIQKTQEGIVEVRNQLYSVLDLKNLLRVSEAQGLVNDPKPGYLEVTAGPVSDALTVRKP